MGQEKPTTKTKGDAMSPQRKAKAEQNFTREPVLHTCSNCAHILTVTRERQCTYKHVSVETSHKCGLGWFAVNKTGSCDRWKQKPQLP